MAVYSTHTAHSVRAKTETKNKNHFAYEIKKRRRKQEKKMRENKRVAMDFSRCVQAMYRKVAFIQSFMYLNIMAK